MGCFSCQLFPAHNEFFIVFIPQSRFFGRLEVVAVELEKVWGQRKKFGDNHKVRLGKKRSKTNGVELGKVASGLWVYPGAISLPRCHPTSAV